MIQRPLNTCRICAASLFILASLLINVAPCLAGDDVAWSTTISTEHNPGDKPGGAIDIPVAIRNDDSGNFYTMIVSVFPEGNGIGGPGRSFALVKLDGDGTELWRREYGDESINTFDLVSGFGPPDRSLAIDALGRPRRAGSDWQGFFVNTGHAMFATRNAWNPENGEHDWVDTWQPPPSFANAFESGFVLNDEGDMFTFGMSQFSFCCSSSYWPYAARINADGTQVWLHSFTDSSERGNNRSAALTGDGHLMALANAINGNLRLTKYDAALGDVAWTMVHEIAGQTAGFNGRMVLDGDDNIIVTGNGVDGNERFARVFKFDENATLLWESTFSTDVAHPDGTNQYFHAQPHVLSDDSFIVAGQFFFADTGWDVVIRRYAADGTVMWHEHVDSASLFGADADERVRVMIEHPDGGVLITAQQWDEDDEQYTQSGLVLHYDIAGELLWHHQRFHPDGAAIIYAQGVAVAANGDVVVGYRVDDNDTNGADALLVRYGEGTAPDCPADLTGSDSVGVPDLLQLLSCWGETAPGCENADITDSGSVGVPDLLILLGAWGPCP